MSKQSSLPTALPKARVDWVKVMVTVARPSAEALAVHDRQEKLQILEDNVQQHRRELVQWIDDQGLSAEVAKIGAPTNLGVFFVKCTPHMVQELRRAPGVTDVLLAEDCAIRPLRN
ncbi:hypothetical protein BH10CHL1_BH10CHL1_15030 [soil metagenome]